jgi:methanogenic corrinoid protein MtbC1
MNDLSAPVPITLSIAAVERDTGLSKDTLRVWERRYGFPQPGRDVFGERAYPLEQVERLRVIRRLMDAGHRPGKLIALPVDQLQALARVPVIAGRPGADPAPEQDELNGFLDLVRSHRADLLRAGLSQAVLRMGLAPFVTGIIAPLNRMIGEAWTQGRLEIFEEHLYTESVQVVLRNAICSIAVSGESPRVLLTTFPDEVHGLGLLMAEALMALEGCRCTSLGIQTPAWDIARAAVAQSADIVALSFSACLSANQVLDGLTQLRAQLPTTTEIWAGGQSPILQRRPPAGVRVLAGLSDIGQALQQWHASHPID